MTRETMTMETLLDMLNSEPEKVPQFVEIEGIRCQWVGAGWLQIGKAEGNEVLITDGPGTCVISCVPCDHDLTIKIEGSQRKCCMSCWCNIWVAPGSLKIHDSQVKSLQLCAPCAERKMSSGRGPQVNHG